MRITGLAGVACITLYFVITAWAYYPCGLVLFATVQDGLHTSRHIVRLGYRVYIECLCAVDATNGHLFTLGVNPDTSTLFGDFATPQGRLCIMQECTLYDISGISTRFRPSYHPISEPIEIPLIHERTVLTNLVFNRPSPTDDSDRDGLSYSNELAHGTNPFNADSDGDGANDYVEVFGTYLNVSINGVSRIINTLGTDPWLPDSDGDGVLDGMEIHGLAPYGFVTDPNNPDTDGDGIIDSLDPDPLGWSDANGDGIPNEWVSFWTNQISLWGFDPGMISALFDPEGDADGDGISNRLEFQQGTAPIVANGVFASRIAPTPLVVTAAPNVSVTAQFDVVNLSWRMCTGALLQLSQPWAEDIDVSFPQFAWRFQYNEDVFFAAHFGVRVPCQLMLNTAQLLPDTVYSDTLRVIFGGYTNICEVLLYVSPSANANHAPRGLELLAPTNGMRLTSIIGQQLSWRAAVDPDGDMIT